MAYNFVCDELRSVKPSCIFHFWCLKQVENVNFQGQTRLLRRPLLEKLYIIGMYSMTLLVDKDPNFHLRSCLGDLDEK